MEGGGPGRWAFGPQRLRAPPRAAGMGPHRGGFPRARRPHPFFPDPSPLGTTCTERVGPCAGIATASWPAAAGTVKGLRKRGSTGFVMAPNHGPKGLVAESPPSGTAAARIARPQPLPPPAAGRMDGGRARGMAGRRPPLDGRDPLGVSRRRNQPPTQWQRASSRPDLGMGMACRHRGR